MALFPGLPVVPVCIHYQNQQPGPMIPAVLEVKCPFSARDLTVTEAAASLKDFFLGVYHNILVQIVCCLLGSKGTQGLIFSCVTFLSCRKCAGISKAENDA